MLNVIMLSATAAISPLWSGSKLPLYCFITQNDFMTVEWQKIKLRKYCNSKYCGVLCFMLPGSMHASKQCACFHALCMLPCSLHTSMQCACFHAVCMLPCSAHACFHPGCKRKGKAHGHVVMHASKLACFAIVVTYDCKKFYNVGHSSTTIQLFRSGNRQYHKTIDIEGVK
jgi:hypothetical protein